jgi:periplasmic protein TonB
MAQVLNTPAATPVAKYGAVELKALYQKYWWRAFGIAIGVHGLIIGSYYAVEKLTAEEAPTIQVRIMKYSELGPPPSIANANIPPPVSVEAPVAKPTVGTPVPVPDAEVSAEQTIASQTEMSQTVAPVGDASGTGDVAIDQDIKIDEDAPPADYTPVEKDPVPIKTVVPKYPEMALKAGLEGQVYVKIWVDKEGKPKQVVLLKSNADIFNEAAIEAAKQFLFTPAYMNNGPVAVWVSMPFKFKLNGPK